MCHGAAGGVVATSLNLRTGARYEVTLMGSQRWVRAARILKVLPDVVVLQLDDGQQLTVPVTAVLSARPLAGQGPSGNPQASARANAHPAGSRGDRQPAGKPRVVLFHLYQREGQRRFRRLAARSARKAPQGDQRQQGIRSDQELHSRSARRRGQAAAGKRIRAPRVRVGAGQPEHHRGDRGAGCRDRCGPAAATVLSHSAAAAYLCGGHRAFPVPPQRGVVS